MAKDVRATDALDRAPAPAGARTSTSDPFAAMLRGALVPTALVASLGVAGAASFGARAAWSAALGGALVMAFFSVSLLVMRQTARLRATTMTAAVLATYAAKIVLLGLVAVAVRDAAWLSGIVLALTMTGCTVVWLAFEVRAFVRLRMLVTDVPAIGVPALRERL